MTIAELHRAIRALIPKQYTISTTTDTQETKYGLTVEFRAFVFDMHKSCDMFTGDSPDAVWEQVKAAYGGTPEDAMATLDTDLSELEAT